MKTKFIGLEGFNEIESLSTEKKKTTSKSVHPSVAYKTVRFVKRASVCLAKAVSKKATEISARNIVKKSDRITAKAVKTVKPKKSTSVLDKCYIENRNGAKSEFTSSLKETVSGISFVPSTKKLAHSSPSSTYRVHTIIKKKAVLAVVACVSAITLSCVTVASALDSYDNTPKIITTSSTVQTAPSENNDNGSEDTVKFNSVFTSTADEATNTLTSDAYASITKALLNDNICNSCSGLYIDGKLIGATSETDALNAALDKVLTDYKEGYDDETTTEFANEVVVKGGNFTEDDIMTVSEIMDAAQDKFSIALSTDIVYTREIEYEVKTEYDDSQSSSYKKVKTEGKNGEEEVTIRTTFTDGMQTDAVETKKKVITEAVDEVVIKGSKNGVANESSSVTSSSKSSSSASGSFCWPVPYTHSISSYYEWRWGRMHNGIDIAAGGISGQAIVASDSGTVIQASDKYNGYGNCVIIDHGNGYQTLYAHCSSLAVSYGQHVSKGDTIGYVGSTGNSTGPHLHFEVIYNSNKLNPLQFVS